MPGRAATMPKHKLTPDRVDDASGNEMHLGTGAMPHQSRLDLTEWRRELFEEGDSVTLDGFTCAIWFQGVYTLCQAPFRTGAAVYDVSIDAAGYAPYVLHVVEDGTSTPGSACCGPCPATTSYTVKLTPYVGPASLMRSAD